MKIQHSFEEGRIEAIIRKAKTIGQLERLAGIKTNADRALFWMQFANLKNRAAKVGKAELIRIIREKGPDSIA